LSSLENFVKIDPAVSASDMIEKCSAVISMPFTSTALLGRAAGKPSIYYDPIGLIQKNDPAAHGIPIVSGEEELNKWISVI
jgi:polysaccharide biosynthesis PFTS motif protein